jgi:hypothetical protein
MKTSLSPLVLLVATFGFAACSQSIQGDNPGLTPQVDAGDNGLVCEDPNKPTACSGTCVDTDTNPTHCGECGASCDQGQGCSNGECVDVCDAGEVLCGGDCIDPNTDRQYCGASGTCEGQNIGENCGENSCSAGQCVSQRYLGSLALTTGRWNFGSTVGVAGAEEACRTLYSAPTAKICSYQELLSAQANGELVGATDNNNNPVASWFIVDAAQNGLARQCTKVDQENLPWTYETADLGQGAKYVTLDSGTGTVSAVLDAPSAGADGCRTQRNVPCCVP